MATGTLDSGVVADVKCYYCGHISGQIVGRRHEPLRVTNFVPRPGYRGPEVKPGVKLRCERCQGPVFLEDTTILGQTSRPKAPATRQRVTQKRAGKAA